MVESSASSASQPPQQTQSKAVEAILDAAKKAFDPATEEAARKPAREEFNEVIQRTETWLLLSTLNALIKPNVLPPWLREPLMQTLTRLPLRPDGVRATMEFVFSVHPSNNGKGPSAGGPQRDGANITHEAVAIATKLLSSVPSQMTPQDWFIGISEQFFALFDGDSGPDLAKTAAQIVGFGILGKKQLGAPGAPGWIAFVQPLIEGINPSLRLTPREDGSSEIQVVDLSTTQVLVPAKALHQSLRRLETLILSNPSPGLCKRVLKPVLLQIWAISSWTNPSQAIKQRVCQRARNLVQTYLRLFGNSESIQTLIKNLLCKGSLEGEEPAWGYRLATSGELHIVTERTLGPTPQPELNWTDIEAKAATLAEIVAFSCSTEEVSSVFLDLLRRWIRTASRQKGSEIDIVIKEEISESAIQDLVDVTVLQKLMEKSPDKLVSHFHQLLELVCQVLEADSRSPLGDDLVAVVLSLLNLIITATTFEKSDMKPSELEIVEEALNRIGGEDRTDVSTTARNLGLLLQYRGEMNDDKNQSTTAPSARQVEDRRTYNLAMSYITGQDSPPPVVSEGLNLLSNLIISGSSILDITAVTVLMSNLLKDNEDYINLRVIKIFTQLAGKHPKSTIQELIDHYLDVQEKASTDIRLRFGEALVQVIERLGETFTGDAAQRVGETLLSIAGRRGHRPNTMAKQARAEKLEKMKKTKQEDLDEDDEPMDDEEVTEEEQAKNEILAQIVQAWESKRGSEDVRMRTSALSIFGAAVETNISGLGPTIVSTGVDLSINVLAMEPELEKGILRRAAILAILSFVKALHEARETGRVLGFGLTNESRADIQRTLEYIAATDNDGLVQQHARDVVESLGNWQASNYLAQQSETNTPGLTRLAGLHVNPGGVLVDASGRPRPRIEEVE